MLVRRKLVLVILGLLLGLPGGASAASMESEALIQRYIHLTKTTRALTDTLPLYLATVQDNKVLNVSLFGLIPYSFNKVASELSKPQSYCEFLPLMFNVKGCVVTETSPVTRIKYYVAGKYYTPPIASIRIKSVFRIIESRKDFLQIIMEDDGDSQGTTKYHVLLKIVPMKNQTLIYIESLYAPGRLTRMATKTYVSMFARNKPGFTKLKVSGGGETQFITGFPAIIERSIVRSYFALKAYLQNQHVPPARRHEARLQSWYNLNLPHRKQLYELERKQYLAIKRRERKNQLNM